MRYNISKKNSTKPERIVYELLKELRIPFRHRWKVGKLEIDFLVGQYAIDIDGHEQNGERNHKIVAAGYVPIHFSNNEIINNRQEIKSKLKDIYELHKFS